MRNDAILIARTEIFDLIEAVINGCAQMPTDSLCEQVNAIRILAGRHQLDAVERLASLLISVVAYNGHRQVAQGYLSLMRDAAQCLARDPSVTAIYLAAAASRGVRC